MMWERYCSFPIINYPQLQSCCYVARLELVSLWSKRWRKTNLKNKLRGVVSQRTVKEDKHIPSATVNTRLIQKRMRFWSKSRMKRLLELAPRHKDISVKFAPHLKKNHSGQYMLIDKRDDYSVNSFQLIDTCLQRSFKMVYQCFFFINTMMMLISVSRHAFIYKDALSKRHAFRILRTFLLERDSNLRLHSLNSALLITAASSLINRTCSERQSCELISYRAVFILIRTKSGNISLLPRLIEWPSNFWITVY